MEIMIEEIRYKYIIYYYKYFMKWGKIISIIICFFLAVFFIVEAKNGLKINE